jgi:hypothetical protein
MSGGFFKRILRPQNALVLLFEHLTDEGADEMEMQIKEVRQYYDFLKLGELADLLKKGKAVGVASVAFKNARKSVFFRGVPLLRSLGVPFTVFARADCIGTNRLPLGDEIDAYAAYYPEKIGRSIASELKAKTWKETRFVDGVLHEWRRSVGPFPLNKMDPTTFFATWKQIVTTDEKLIEIGIHIIESPESSSQPGTDLEFVRRQIGRSVRVAYCEQAVNEEWLTSNGIVAQLGTESGEVGKKTNPMRLPHWIMERTSAKEKDKKDD